MRELLTSASFPSTAQGVGHQEFSLAQALDTKQQLSCPVGLSCRHSTPLKLLSSCRPPPPIIPALSTVLAALLLQTYRPISTIKPASAASLSPDRHCLIMEK